jgi:hypothetical protein
MIHISVACLEGEMSSHFVPKGRWGVFLPVRHNLEILSDSGHLGQFVGGIKLRSGRRDIQHRSSNSGGITLPIGYSGSTKTSCDKKYYRKMLRFEKFERLGPCMWRPDIIATTAISADHLERSGIGRMADMMNTQRPLCTSSLWKH